MKTTKIFRALAALALFVGLNFSLSSCFYHDYRYPRHEHYGNYHRNYGGHYGGNYGGNYGGHHGGDRDRW